MKPSSYNHTFVLPTDRWLNEATSYWKGYTPEEVVISFFEALRFIDSNNWIVSKDRYVETVHILVTLMISDLEGSSPVPQEFEFNEIDRLEKVARNMLLELMRIIHPECWQARMRLNYIRLIGHDVLLHYVADHPFQIASVQDLPPMYQRYEE